MNVGTDTNILHMLDMTVDDYGYLSTLFICTYVVFEIPSNFMIKWATPRVSPKVNLYQANFSATLRTHTGGMVRYLRLSCCLHQ